VAYAYNYPVRVHIIQSVAGDGLTTFTLRFTGISEAPVTLALRRRSSALVLLDSNVAFISI